MKKIYLIKFTKVGWDEYFGFVVRAESEYDAMMFLKKEYPPEHTFTGVNWSGGYTITEVSQEGETCIILDSYNAA